MQSARRWGDITPGMWRKHALTVLLVRRRWHYGFRRFSWSVREPGRQLSVSVITVGTHKEVN